MTLIAKKPCSFGGKKFYLDDIIPSEYVINPKEQEKMGVLAIVDGDHVTGGTPAGNNDVTPHLTIDVKTDEGNMPLEVTVKGVQEIFGVLTGNVEEGEAIISEMTDDDALILLHMSDSRKSIKTAAEARAKALNESTESAGEQ